MPEREKVATSINFDADVLAKLDEYAGHNDRNRSNMVNVIIREKLGMVPLMPEPEELTGAQPDA